MLGNIVKLLGKLFGKLWVNHGKPSVKIDKKNIFPTSEQSETPINLRVNQQPKQKQNEQKIITARPANMLYEEYRIIRKQQTHNIKNYLRGRMVVEMNSSSRWERRERSRLLFLFDKAKKPYHFHPHLYKRLKNVGLLLPTT